MFPSIFCQNQGKLRCPFNNTCVYYVSAEVFKCHRIPGLLTNTILTDTYCAHLCVITNYFASVQTADQQYQDAFNDELESFKDRVRGRAKIRIEKAMKEYEEEEKQKRLGPGGLDPVEVYESLPPVSQFFLKQYSPLYLFISQLLHKAYTCLQEMQKCFDDKDIQMLQDVISKMDPTVSCFPLAFFLDLHMFCFIYKLNKLFDVINVIAIFSYYYYFFFPQEAKAHMKRCVDSGLWVPNSKTDEGEEKEEEPTYEEVKQEQEESKKE